MALHPGFHQWLTRRGLLPATISVLQKESIFQESTLKLLNDTDLQSLRDKHGITLGQFALLRSVHGDLQEAEEDGFEVVELEDAPAELGVRGGEPGSASRRHKNKASKYTLGGDRQVR